MIIVFESVGFGRGGQTHPMYIDKQKCLNKKNKQYIFTNLENPTLWGRGMVIIKNFNCNDNFVIFTPIFICSQKSGGEVATSSYSIFYMNI